MLVKEQRSLIGLSTFVGLLLVTMAVGGWFLYQWFSQSEPVSSAPSDNVAIEHSSSGEVLQSQVVNDNTKPSGIEPQPDAELAAMTAGFELEKIGIEPWSDDQFHRLTRLLKEHPEVIDYLALVYRENTDRDAMRRLAQLLGQFDTPIITDVGIELALSGETKSQRTGLLLLGKQQARNPRARNAIADLMSVETKPNVLSSALNAMAKPAKINSAEQRDLLDRFTVLSENPDVTVRALSVSVIAAWSRDVDMTPVLVGALEDTDTRVRENAAFAFLKSRHLPEDAKFALFARVEDSTESKRTRQAALYALQRFTLSSDEQARYEDGKLTVQRAKKY